VRNESIISHEPLFVCAWEWGTLWSSGGVMLSLHGRTAFLPLQSFQAKSLVFETLNPSTILYIRPLTVPSFNAGMDRYPIRPGCLALAPLVLCPVCWAWDFGLSLPCLLLARSRLFAFLIQHRHRELRFGSPYGYFPHNLHC